LLTRILVQITTCIPDLRRFHLGRFQSLKERERKVVESIDGNSLHVSLFFLQYSKSGRPLHVRTERDLGGIAFSPPRERRRVFPLPLIKWRKAETEMRHVAQSKPTDFGISISTS
jgi:hypothetical protein